MNLHRFLAAPARRRVIRNLASVAEVCESRTLLSAKALKIMGPELPRTNAPPQQETGGPFHGTWYVYLNNELQGNITFIQEGKEVNSETNEIFAQRFEGKAKGNTLKISTELPGEDITITWKVSLDNPNHFSGEQTVKIKGNKKTTSSFVGDTSIL